MRLAEYLFGDPGGPPQPDHGVSDMLPEMPDGRTVHDYPYSFGGAQGMETCHDPSRIHGIAHLDGQPIHHLAQGYSQDTAMRYRQMFGESISGHSVLTLSEVLKKGKNEPSARDRKAIKRLQDGSYPAKAEDGKGFCFQWADGRGICAFKMRSDALRWAKAEPRDIVKFWYGEPVHSNGKFRIRVADHYSKEESVETFSSLLERRARVS